MFLFAAFRFGLVGVGVGGFDLVWFGIIQLLFVLGSFAVLCLIL